MPTKLKGTQLETGTGPGAVVVLDGTSKLPAVDGSNLTLVNATTLGGQPVGTGPLDIVALDGSSRLPAVDGSQLTNLPGGGGLADVVDDTTPQLGGNLDVNGNDIITPTITTGVNGAQMDILAGGNTYAGGGYTASGIRIRSGFASNGNTGGALTISGGGAYDTSNASAVSIAGGQSVDGNSGSVGIAGGNATGSGVPGAVTISAGRSQPTGTNDGASVLISGGDGGAGYTGGDVVIEPGQGIGSTTGTVQIHAGNLNSGNGALEIWRDTNFTHTTGFKAELTVSSALTADVSWTIPAAQQSSGDPLGIDLGEYIIASLPAAGTYPNCWALATDASGGRTVVRSDGTNWKVIAVEGATVA